MYLVSYLVANSLILTLTNWMHWHIMTITEMFGESPRPWNQPVLASFQWHPW